MKIVIKNRHDKKVEKWIEDENDDIIKGITDAADAIVMIVKNGEAREAMNKYNKKGSKEKPKQEKTEKEDTKKED